jgi:hypothetical protein
LSPPREREFEKSNSSFRLHPTFSALRYSRTNPMSLHASAYAYPANTTDADLVRRAQAYLASRGFLSFRRLEIESRGGVVTLAGRLSRYYERQVALESVRRVAGVLSVVDAIRVEADRPSPPPNFARVLQILEQPEVTAVARS